MNEPRYWQQWIRHHVVRVLKPEDALQGGAAISFPPAGNGDWSVSMGNNAAVQVSGGSGGIIMDNVVSSTTMAGTSQVYLSTLSNQACTMGGTGGRAVQASQSALQ